MRKILTAVSFAVGIGFVWCQDAGAFPADPAAMKEAATAASTVQQTQYAGHFGRHHATKCYREFVIGSYVCHSYRYW